MFVDESKWIRRALESLGLAPGTAVLDIGSSSLWFRTVAQPYVDREVFAPLRARGIEPFHLDARAEEGVDLVADVTRLDGVDRTFDVVLCTNLLEHVVDRSETMKNVARVVRPAGMLILTVPLRYPIHPDPIDTGFRPTAAELVRMLGWAKVRVADDVTVRDPEHYRGKRWFRRFVRPWKIACVLAQKPG